MNVIDYTPKPARPLGRDLLPAEVIRLAGKEYLVTAKTNSSSARMVVSLETGAVAWVGGDERLELVPNARVVIGEPEVPRDPAQLELDLSPLRQYSPAEKSYPEYVRERSDIILGAAGNQADGFLR